ncbi:hypothetical protein BLSTO_03542 [Blastocystis sp. subtype 1]
MDFKGQKLAFFLTYLIIISFSVIGALAGIVMDSFYLAFKIVVAGLIVASVVCIPDWPFYNRNPVQWAGKEKSE